MKLDFKGFFLVASLFVSLFASAAHAGASMDHSSYFNVSVSGTSLNISTLTEKDLYPSAGIKVLTPGVSLAGVGSECQMNAETGYCLFAVGKNTPATISLSGASGVVSIVLCLDGAAPMSCQYYYPTIAAGITSAYIADQNYGTLSICDVNNTDGSLSNCTNVSSPNNPTLFDNIAYASVNATGSLAYVIDVSNYDVYVCPIGAGGILGSCTQTNPLTAGGAAFTQSTALDPSGDYLYYSQIGPGTQSVQSCPINPDGSLGTCTDASAYSFTQAIGITLNQEGNTAFIADSSAGNVTFCLVSSGSFPDCGPSTQSFNTPTDVALNPTETLAYVVQNSPPSVSVCTVGSYSFTSCIDSGFDGFTSPVDIAILPSGDYAYVSDWGNFGSGNGVYLCEIDQSDGTFCNCSFAAGTTFVLPAGITLF